MFNKNNVKDLLDNNEPTPQMSATEEDPPKGSKDSAKPAVSNARSVSYIGPDFHFTGVVNAQEGLVVEGCFEGKLIQEDKPLTVGKKGRIYGEIQASEIDVRGTIEGDIYATQCIRLHAGCNVTGVIYCKSISTEEGATFNGKVDMTLDEIKPEAANIELAASNEKTVTKKSA